MNNLRYDLYTAPDGHPQEVMRILGITYEHATPQSIADQWWFWNCSNVPDPMPEYLSVLTTTPRQAIGLGLSWEDAKRLESASGPDSPQTRSRLRRLRRQKRASKHFASK